jgi:hypothetical protein
MISGTSQRRPVEKDAVRRLAVLAERLAVVGGVDHRVATEAERIERSSNRAACASAYASPA